jgi:hypothetical protein
MFHFVLLLADIDHCQLISYVKLGKLVYIVYNLKEMFEI